MNAITSSAHRKVTTPSAITTPATAGALVCLAVVFSAQSAAVAQGVPTGQPFDNYQSSLVVTEYTPLSGTFPVNGGSGGALGDTLGFVYDFAGNFAPDGSVALEGETLPISGDPALFQILGTTYGGNGVSTFALPNLSGRAIVGAGQGPGLPNQTLGATSGSATVSLTPSQLPAPSGQGKPVDNVQPSLTLTPMIAVQGPFPDAVNGPASASFIGQIANFAGNYAPAGWLPADGRVLSINDNQSLFSIIGPQYGGNGITTFALPDLRGRVAVGNGGTRIVGEQFGSQTNTLAPAQVQPQSPAPLNNVQPSIAVAYLIATTGVYPRNPAGGLGVSTTTPTVGEITEYLGGLPPAGWMYCFGQLLPIAQYQALFSVIGTTYGGDGRSTFALPDLRDRTLIGSGPLQVGTLVGSNQIVLSSANVPAVPEPNSWALLGAGLCAVGLFVRRSQGERR